MYKPSKPFKQRIIDEIQKTWKTPYVKVHFNTYPIIERNFSYPEVDHTDGIGTKGLYHWKKGTFKNAVIDALAMNLNDLAIVRATPYKLSNHITVPLEDIRVFRIVQEMVRQCLKYKIAIVGGENSFHNNMDGLDISMTVSGFVKKPAKNQFRRGDVLIGFKSSGLHSNGITTVRRLFGERVRDEFVKPTVIYSQTILNLIEDFDIHGMMHITGGAFTKLKDILGNNDARIRLPKKLKPQKIFFDLYKKGLSNADMYATFNCGTGFIISTSKAQAVDIISHVKDSEIIGEVISGDGKVYIASAFDGKEIVF